MSKTDEIKKRYEEIKDKEKVTINNLEKIKNEEIRTRDFARDAPITLAKINEDFERETGLDAVDQAFLCLATGLQLSKQLMIARLNHLSETFINDHRLQHNDPRIHNVEKKLQDGFKNKAIEYNAKGYWIQILEQPVPFDTTIGSRDICINMEAKYHRIHTLGHDPILGWIFGTANILTDTITMPTFESYRVARHPYLRILPINVSLIELFNDAYLNTKADPMNLAAAIFKEAIHLGSDAFTKVGLPIPVLETIDPVLAGHLYKENYDSLCLLKDTGIIRIQKAVSILINMLISVLHGFYYNAEKGIDKDTYEIKTRKIITISNTIASSINLGWVGSNLAVGKKSRLKDLDIGGIEVTISSIVTNSDYMSKLKEEYIRRHFFNQLKTIEKI